MAIYAVLMLFGAILGMTTAIVDWFFGDLAACGFVAVWAAIGILIAAPVIVERGRPGKLDDLLKYLAAAIILGPFMITGMVDFYGKD